MLQHVHYFCKFVQNTHICCVQVAVSYMGYCHKWKESRRYETIIHGVTQLADTRKYRITNFTLPTSLCLPCFFIFVFCLNSFCLCFYSEKTLNSFISGSFFHKEYYFKVNKIPNILSPFPFCYSKTIILIVIMLCVSIVLGINFLHLKTLVWRKLIRKQPKFKSLNLNLKTWILIILKRCDM